MEVGASSMVLNTGQYSCFSSISPNCQVSSNSSSFCSRNFSKLSLSFPYRDCTPVRATLKDIPVSTEKEIKKMPSEIEFSSLTAFSPLDGRYWGKVKELAPYMSEYALIYYRVLVEIQWLLKLSQIPDMSEVPSFSKNASSYLQGVIDGFSEDDALEIKKIE